MNMNSQTGFTLYELLITVLVIGVILTLGVPNMQEFTRNGRITAASSDLHASFLLARSEAVRARANVTICGLDLSADPTLQPACGGSFQNGWIVFVDGTNDIVRDAGDVVLRTFPAVDAGLVRISTNAGANYFSFAGTGLGRGNVMGAGTALVSAVVCDDRGNPQISASTDATPARAVVATPTGRATVLRGHTQVAAQITNNSLTCS